MFKKRNFSGHKRDYLRNDKRYAKKVKINSQILAPRVRLINNNGEQVGIVDVSEAMRQAEEVGLDLVEISLHDDPPVCKIIDFGKYLFDRSKRFKHKSKRVHVKEIKLRPVTDTGDYLIKIKKAIEFLKDGDKVKFVIKFKGREVDYQNLGIEMLKRIQSDLLEYGSTDCLPSKAEGRQLTVSFVPKKSGDRNVDKNNNEVI